MKRITNAKVGEQWMWIGIATSLVFHYSGLEPESYSIYIPFGALMLFALLVHLKLRVFFERVPAGDYLYDVSQGPSLISRIIQWEIASMATLGGWILGDVIHLFVVVGP